MKNNLMFMLKKLHDKGIALRSMTFENIFNEKGELVAKKGEVVNPFEKITYKKTLIFFDADDKAQFSWVEANYKKYQHVKFILTGGSVKDATNLLGRVYFDWKGALTKKLHLEHVPSVVEQKGLQWQITEGRV